MGGLLQHRCPPIVAWRGANKRASTIRKVAVFHRGPQVDGGRASLPVVGPRIRSARALAGAGGGWDFARQYETQFGRDRDLDGDTRTSVSGVIRH